MVGFPRNGGGEDRSLYTSPVHFACCDFSKAKNILNEELIEDSLLLVYSRTIHCSSRSFSFFQFHYRLSVFETEIVESKNRTITLRTKEDEHYLVLVGTLQRVVLTEIDGA